MLELAVSGHFQTCYANVAMNRNSINRSAMASPKPAAMLTDAETRLQNEALRYYGYDVGETALTGAKRGFANLAGRDEPELHPTKKVCTSHEFSSNRATATILKLQATLKERDQVITNREQAMKAQQKFLDAAMGELERWKAVGDTNEPKVVMEALDILRASESELKQQLLTAKRREAHMLMTVATTAQEVVDLKRKLQAAEERIKLLVPEPAPDLQQQVLQEESSPEAAVPDISYPQKDVAPPISQQIVQQAQNLEGQDQPPVEPVLRPQDIWEVQPRRPRQPTEVEKQRAAEWARSFESTNPFLIATMRPSQVYNGFSICLRSTVLPTKTEDATLLDGTGKSWICKYLVNLSGKRLSAGWKRFALDHELEEGDVLVFEVVSREVLTMLVHIFRVELDNSTVGVEEKLHYYDGVSPVRRKKGIRQSRAKAREMALVSSSLDLPEGLATLNAATHSERQPENEANGLSRASNQRTPSSLSPHSQRRSVTMEERRGAELAARALKTANPSVMVVLTKSSVQYHFCLTIPCAFAKQWLPNALVPVTLCDSAGQRATARWAGNRKTAHLKGFKTFALTHSLEEGDVLVLELMDANPANLVFLVHMFRVVEVSSPGLTSRDFVDKEVSDSENNGSETSKSRIRQNGDSNVAAGEFVVAATPSSSKDLLCVEALPLAMKMPQHQVVFEKSFVSGGGAATLEKKHEKTVCEPTSEE